MTNQDRKEKIIAEAWISLFGERNFNLLKGRIGENGTMYLTKRSELIPQLEHLIPDFIDIIETNTLLGYTPKSLSGIENNLGWIRIEEDRSNLPIDEKDSGIEFDWYTKEGNIYRGESWAVRMASIISETHYRPIEKHQPPLY